MKNTYIFDFDGTLVNSLPSIAYFANNALNKYGLPSIPEERYKNLRFKMQIFALQEDDAGL